MFVIYGKPDCTYCIKAKAALDWAEHHYIYKDITLEESYRQEFECYGHPTVPLVLLDVGQGQCQKIGGYDDLFSYLEETL